MHHTYPDTICYLYCANINCTSSNCHPNPHLHHHHHLLPLLLPSSTTLTVSFYLKCYPCCFTCYCRLNLSSGAGRHCHHSVISVGLIEKGCHLQRYSWWWKCSADFVNLPTRSHSATVEILSQLNLIPKQWLS